jgi:hypothetical protein
VRLPTLLISLKVSVLPRPHPRRLSGRTWGKMGGATLLTSLQQAPKIADLL